MTVAAIIVTAGRDRHLARTLAGLARQHRPPDEVIVVRMDAEPSLAVGAAGAPTTIALGAHDRTALPLARARNAGAEEAADHDHLVFLDVDCIPAADVVVAYEDALTCWPGAVVSGPARYLDEGWDRPPPGVGDDAALAARSRPPAARPVPAAGAAIEVGPELFWSLAFGVSSATWQRVGGFDEGYVGYGAEDTDFGYRARAASVPVVLVPDGVVFHQWHPPSRRDPALLAGMVANARRFRRRWGVWPMAGWFDELARAGLVRFDPGHDVLEPS